MRAEVTFLFHLEDYYKVAKEAHIGNGVRLEIIFNESQRNWRDEIINSDPRLKARSELDEGYNWRIYVSLDEVANEEDPRIEQARQLILRAIVLSRIIHPTPIATGSPWIKSFYPDTDPPYHRCECSIGPYIRAYTAPAHSELTITQDDAARMAELWANFQHLFDNEEKYRKIIRALKYFDGGYHLWNSEFRHMVFCAALESLISTPRDSIKAQFAQRLPRLVPEITERQALTIYYLLDDFKHRASPWLIKKTDSREMVADNKERSDAVQWAEESLRSLLQRAVSDQAFADLLADGGEFARQYPVEIKKSSIGDFIIRDPGVRGGRPIIDGTGITVNRIATWYNLGLRPEEIAGRIGHLSLAQVYAALAHYHTNRDEIDAEIAAEEVEADRLEQEHYLSLQSRS
jgi:uncharacterized protein (DUF433 family)